MDYSRKGEHGKARNARRPLATRVRAVLLVSATRLRLRSSGKRDRRSAEVTVHRSDAVLVLVWCGTGCTVEMKGRPVSGIYTPAKELYVSAIPEIRVKVRT